MKVAIIGAGLSGLSCAFELKKHGIKPTIFEQRSRIGDHLDYSVAILRMFNPFNVSPKRYFRKNYNLAIAPLSEVKEIRMIGSNNKTVVRGKLGYVFKKGLEPYSAENQIAKQVNLPINFDTFINIDDIKKDFDCIVWATGNNKLPSKLNVWTSTFNTHIRIATVLGEFKTNSITMWVNENYSKNGYVYLLPNSKSTATLALTINNISPKEIDHYWKVFLERERIQYKILETRDLEFITGFVSPMKLDNIYFVGNAGGLTESCLGCGVINAIESGIIAGKCISKNLDYDRFMRKTTDAVRISYELRKLLNTFDNRDFDRLVTFLGLPLIKQIIYNNPFYKSTYSAQIVKLYNNFTENQVYNLK